MVQWALYEVRKLSILPILCRHVFGHARLSTMGGCTEWTVQGGSALPRVPVRIMSPQWSAQINYPC